MPKAPPKPCNYPGCPSYQEPGYPFCDKHIIIKAREHYSRRKVEGRLSSQIGWYGTNRWKRLRSVHLSEYPLCKHCDDNGLIVPATEVDHRIPHKGNYESFFDPRNLQSLCKSCHSRKTALEDSGFVKRKR